MNEGLAPGDVVKFCNDEQGYKHNALVAECDKNGMVTLIHIVQHGERVMQQVELNVPWQTPDPEGRYYIVEAM
jgi:hypothetical protein